MAGVSVLRWLAGHVPGLERRLEGSHVGGRLLRGFLWNVAGTVVSRVLLLAASIIVARTLGKQGFGELGLIQSTVSMFAVFAVSGIGATATKYLAELRHRDPERAGRILSLSNATAIAGSAVAALLLLALSPWLARAVLATPHLVPALAGAAAVLFLTGLAGAQTGALAGLEAFRAIARVQFRSGLISFPLLVAGAMLGGLMGTVAAMAVAACFSCALNHIALRRETRRVAIPRAVRWQADDLAVLWRFTLPSVMSVLLVAPVHWVCSAMVAKQASGFEHLGAFNAANQWFTVLMFLPGVLGQSVLPLMAERFGAKARPDVLHLLRIAFKLNGLVTFPALALGLASPWLMGLFGSDFRSEWPTLVVALATAALLAIQTPVGQVLTASGNLWLGFLMNLGWALVYVGATWLLLGWGALGFATARLVAYAVHAIWTFAYALRLLRAEPATAGRAPA